MASNSSTMASIPSVTISFENFGDFANDGDESDTAQNAVYRVNGDPAYQLVIDGAITGTVAYDGYDAVFAASHVLEDAITLSFATGQVFTPGAIVLSNYATSLADQTVVITGYNASSQQVGAAVTHTLANNYYGALASESIALPGMTGITRLVITATTLGGQIEYLMIDGISMTNIQPPAPAIVSVSSSTANGSYNAGDVITLTVTFDRAVDVDTTDGLATLQLETGSTDHTAGYAGGSGTATLSFSYTVQAGDTSADLDYTSTGALVLNGATIKAAGGGADADLVLPAPGAAGALGANKAIVLDSTAPTLAITSDKAALKAGETAAITFTFSESPGASFTGADVTVTGADVTVTGGTLGALSGSGLTRTATLTPTPGTNGGSASISVVAGSYTDAAGNPGEAGAGPALGFDTLAPTVSITSDKAALKAGQTATITFTFSEDPGASFTLGDVTASGGSLGPLAGSGLTRTATFTPTAATNNGTASITVAAGAYLDAGGNAGGAGATPALAFDTLAPGAPAAPDLAAASDTGSSPTDNLTKDTALTLRGVAGSAEAGATIRLYQGATLIATTAAAGDGRWAADSIFLAEGAHTITATATDAAGNTSAASGGLTVTIDRTAPAAPGIPDLATGSDSGSSSSDNISSVNTPTVCGAVGSVAAGATVTLYDSDGSTVIGSTTAAGDGSWSVVTSVLSEGVHTITAKALDAAGNLGAASSALALTIDRTGPATSAVSLAFSADSGASNIDLVTAIAAQTVSGTLDASLAAGERVEVSTDNGASWLPATAAAGGTTWSLATTLIASDTLRVRVVDAAGNAGTAFACAYVFDTAAPAAPSTPDLASASDTGLSAADDITGDTTPTFTGSAESGALVILYDGATAIGSAVAAGGVWSITSSALAQGNHSITANARDAAGNDGAASSAIDVFVETGAPATAAASVALAADTGASGTDLVTRTAVQTISGTLDANLAAGERVEVSLDGGGNWTTASAAVGASSWSLPATLADGVHTLQVRVANAVDNTGPVLQRAVTLDTAAPAVTLTSSAAQLKAGESATITFSFSEDPGSSFDAADIAVSGGALGALTGSGLTRSAIFAPDAGIDGGTASISVGAASYGDLAGNSGSAGTLAALAFDTLAPGAPAAPRLAATSDTGTAGDGITGTASPRIEGTAAANAQVTLYAGAAMAGSATADALGHWSIATALGFGSHTLTATQSDAAGNVSAASAAFMLRIDAPPSAPQPLVDGVPVRQQPVLLPGGVLGTAVLVPIVTGSRVESSGRADVADIPLATSGGATVLMAQLSPGFGLRTSGASLPAAEALESLVNAIEAATPFHAPADQGHLTGSGLAFLAGLAPAESLLVQTVAPFSTALPGGVLTLAGAPAEPGRSVALLIDTARLAGGGTIELRDIDFAAVVGNADILASGNPLLVGDGANQRFTVEAGSTATVFAGGGADILGFGMSDSAATSQQRAPALPTGDVATLHGGQGIDSASFRGARSDYDIAWHNGYVVVGSKSDPAASAMLVNVEMLRFADGSIAVGNAGSAPGLETLAGMYQSVLGRQPDLDGFEFWADAHDAGASWGTVALHMIGSSERATAGGGFNGHVEHDIRLLYTALFEREADAAGLAFWQQAMEHGVTLAQVATDFLESVEMVGHRRAMFDWDFSM